MGLYEKIEEMESFAFLVYCVGKKYVSISDIHNLV